MATDRRNEKSNLGEQPIFNLKVLLLISVALFLVNNQRVAEKKTKIVLEQQTLVEEQIDAYTSYIPIIVDESSIEIVTFGEVPGFVNFEGSIYRLTNTWTNSDGSTGAAYQVINTTNPELFTPYAP